MHPATALMVSKALAEEHRREAERRRRTERQRRQTPAPAPRRQIAWPFRLFRPSAAGSGA